MTPEFLGAATWLVSSGELQRVASREDDVLGAASSVWADVEALAN
jgi:hypothetical protein